jgi:flagellar hook protein FlgE
MFSAISGLRAHQTKMDVTGNNIANVNTVGFKGSQTVFQDTLSQVMRAGGAPAADRGGNNPAQVGLGVKLAAVTTNWTQGATQTTGRSTDFMIEGDGFFVTRSGTEQMYTRAGSFDFDGEGKLVTPDGSILQGWLADANGTVNPNSPITNLSVPYGQTVAPKRSDAASVAGNLPSESLPTDPPVRTSTTMYDAQGVAHQVGYTFSKAPLPATNQWTVTVDIDGVTAPTTPASAPVNFNADGSLIDPTPLTPYTVSFTPPAASFPGWMGGSVTVDLTGMRQYGSANTVTAGDQNGYALGTLEAFSLGNDGTITGVYSNGERKALGQLALASFNNPSGLEKAGSSSFRVGDNSGAAMVGQAGTGGRGVLNSGALEMSNVDLAEEFTGLIVAQRGFQANSRVITSSDEILQDLVNLKR